MIAFFSEQQFFKITRYLARIIPSVKVVHPRSWRILPVVLCSRCVPYTIRICHCPSELKQELVSFLRVHHYVCEEGRDLVCFPSRAGKEEIGEARCGIDGEFRGGEICEHHHGNALQHVHTR